MLTYILLQASGGGGGGMMQFVLLGGLFVVMYLFILRPQQKKQKDQRKFVDAVGKGDRVVTLGGMHGKIVELTDDTVVLEIDRGVKITFEKTAISFEASKKYKDS